MGSCTGIWLPAELSHGLRRVPSSHHHQRPCQVAPPPSFIASGHRLQPGSNQARSGNAHKALALPCAQARQCRGQAAIGSWPAWVQEARAGTRACQTWPCRPGLTHEVAWGSPMVAHKVVPRRRRGRGGSVRAAMGGPQQGAIKVVVNGAAGRMGREAIRAITRARGMEVAGAVDKVRVGEDVGEVAGLAEPLELPIVDNLVLVLTSIAQARTGAAVMVDFTEPGAVFENVKQAVAFGLRAVVGTRGLSPKKLNDLLEFCDKASAGCIVAPNLSIGSVILEQAAAAAAFHYGHVEVLETGTGGESAPSASSVGTAEALSDLGRVYNDGDSSTTSPARGAVIGDAGVRVHSLRMPGLLTSQEVRFGAPGELFTVRHDIFDSQAYMPGLLLAIRRVVRLKALVYGLEKVL